MIPTMAENVTAILAAFTEVLGAVVSAIGDIAGFMATNPLFVVAIGLTIVGFAFNIVRGFVRN